MSHRGIMTNRLYVSVEVEFNDVWDDLDSDEQKNIVTSNIGMIDTDELIAELEYRGYVVKEEGEDGNE
jgi:hypothetical protein